MPPSLALASPRYLSPSLAANFTLSGVTSTPLWFPVHHRALFPSTVPSVLPRPQPSHPENQQPGAGQDPQGLA